LVSRFCLRRYNLTRHRKPSTVTPTLMIYVVFKSEQRLFELSKKAS